MSEFQVNIELDQTSEVIAIPLLTDIVTTAGDINDSDTWKLV